MKKFTWIIGVSDRLSRRRQVAIDGLIQGRWWRGKLIGPYKIQIQK